MREFYSVAQHSVIVSERVPPEHALWGLLHDASEAYLCDVARPVKRLPELAGYRDAEAAIMRAVSDRFGLWIGFPAMDQATYLAAVVGYAERYDLKVPDIERRALQWAQLRGGRSGRVAWQFIRDLAGELGRPLPL